MKMSVWSLACRESVFYRYHSEKHLPEFYPQDGGECQLALKLRHCHPIPSRPIIFCSLRNHVAKCSVCLFIVWLNFCTFAFRINLIFLFFIIIKLHCIAFIDLFQRIRKLQILARLRVPKTPMFLWNGLRPLLLHSSVVDNDGDILS